MEILVLQIAAELKDKEANTVYSFFHQSKKKDASEAGWILSSAKLNKCNKGVPKEVVIFSYDIQLLGEIKKSLYRVLENDGFFKENFNRVASLTKTEKEILKLLAAGMSSNEISTAKYISVHTVNTHRKNINNKLAIKSFAGLLKFAEVFEINQNSV
jgi:DNA-binding CsgD family transcriptional regulator